jgi:hypothetical protein
VRIRILIKSAAEPCVCYLPTITTVQATADPEQGAVVYSRDKYPIVIVEGIYTLLDDGEWEGLPQMYDMRIFVNSDLEKCIARLKIRNRCIPGCVAVLYLVPGYLFRRPLHRASHREPLMFLSRTHSRSRCLSFLARFRSLALSFLARFRSLVLSCLARIRSLALSVPRPFHLAHTCMLS